MELDKLKKSASAIDKFLKILQGFAIAGIIISVIFIPLTFIFGEKIVYNETALTFGSISLKLQGDYFALLNPATLKTSILAMLLTFIIMCAIGWYSLRILRDILLPMKEGAPFRAGIANKIRKLAFVLLFGGIISEVCRAVSSFFNLFAYDLTPLFNPEHVAGISFNYSINGSFIVIVLILFVLSFIFRYGEELQRESDETL